MSVVIVELTEEERDASVSVLQWASSHVAQTLKADVDAALQKLRDAEPKKEST